MADTPFSWKQCFDQVTPNLVLYARQLTSNRADADDVVQMAFVRWWRRFPDGDPKHIPLLYAAVRTIALDLRRSNNRRAAREAESDISLTEGEPLFEDSTLENRETATLVEEALSKLPEEQREVITLKLWGGLTFAQIAEATGESINTVAGRYRYALNALQKHLAPLKADLIPHHQSSAASPVKIFSFPQSSEVLS